MSTFNYWQMKADRMTVREQMLLDLRRAMFIPRNVYYPLIQKEKKQMNTQPIASEKIQIVIDNLKKILPRAKLVTHLNMGVAKVNSCDHTCGTIHCVGGWYAIAVCDLTTERNYMDGADEMAQHLGFPGDNLTSAMNLLQNWACENPAYWGNNYGDEIFSDNMAYYHPEKRPYGALTLKQVVEHFKDMKVIALKHESLIANPPVDEVINNLIPQTESALMV